MDAPRKPGDPEADRGARAPRRRSCRSRSRAPARPSTGRRRRRWSRRRAEPELVHILSPFDPLIIQRKRLKLFFDYEHRFEAYVPKEKRVLRLFRAAGARRRRDRRGDRPQDRPREAASFSMQKWTWVGTGCARAHKRPIEEELRRFERFQLGTRRGLPRAAKCGRSQPAMAGSSPLLSAIFASAAVGEIFSDRAVLQAMLDFEAALAAAEAEVGRHPRDRGRADQVRLRRGALRSSTTIGKEAALAGNVAIPLVKALTAKVNEKARGYVHWGATSQDVIDTGFVLSARRAIDSHARRSCSVDAGARRAGREASRHGHGRPHADAAGAADHLRLQGRRLALRPDRRGGAAAARRGAMRSRCSSAARPERSRRSGRTARRSRARARREAAT